MAPRNPGRGGRYAEGRELLERLEYSIGQFGLEAEFRAAGGSAHFVYLCSLVLPCT